MKVSKLTGAQMGHALRHIEKSQPFSTNRKNGDKSEVAFQLEEKYGELLSDEMKLLEVHSKSCAATSLARLTDIPLKLILVIMSKGQEI